MAKLIINIEQFKAELKDKWLDYYKANRNWIENLNGNGYRVNDSWFILGIITALEPKLELKELLQYFLLVSKDCDSIIEGLGLDFDLEEELKKRTTELDQKETQINSEYLDQIREEIKT
jgi:hypothetical protein